VAKLHHKISAAKTGLSGGASTDADTLMTAIGAFVTGCRRPAALEHGEEPAPLVPGQYALEIRSGKLWIEVSSETRSLSRRILEIERHATGVLDCIIQRFGGKTGKLTILDLDRPQAAHRSLRGLRNTFAEQFRRMLSRQFPGFEISFLSSNLDLQRSFSSVLPRASLQRGNQQIAALGCPSAENERELLSFALIWHDYVSARSRPGTRTELCLFLPEGSGKLSVRRLRWLTGRSLISRLFLFNSHGLAGEVDPRDLGNIETRVASVYRPAQWNDTLAGLIERLNKVPGVGYSPELNGAISIRFRGLEFARIEPARLVVGIEDRRELDTCQTEEVATFAAHLAGLAATRRSASSETPGTDVLAERWLESAVRAHLPMVDASLLAEPVHGQVLTSAAGDRDLIDLLAIGFSGRLSVLELKAAEDIHLPLQALDYWTHVTWHARRGELRHLFPGIEIRTEAPRLALIAPALAFHPTNTTILRYFSPEIEVERIGVNSDWQHNFKVVLRLKDAENPQSHGSSQ
jgi:hypothetical protein